MGGKHLRHLSLMKIPRDNSMFKNSLLFLLMVANFLIVACDKKDPASEEAIRSVLSMRVDVDNVLENRRFTGKAQAANDVVLAFEVPGKLNEITVRVGDQVKQGQLLASLDSRDFDNALNVALAEEKRAKSNYQRIKQAAAQNAVSKQELSDAQAAFESASANVRIKNKAKDDAALHAPYDAVVSEKYVESFENVKAKQKAIRLVNANQIEMVVDISEDLINLVIRNMAVLVEFDAVPGIYITGFVSEIGAEASEITRTYPVTVLMDQPKEKLIKPGMTGKAWAKNRIEGAGNSKGFEIPITALFFDEDEKSYIWLIDEESGEISKKEVKSGDITKQGIRVEGIAVGDIIATAGINALKEGQKVRAVLKMGDN